MKVLVLTVSEPALAKVHIISIVKTKRNMYMQKVDYILERISNKDRMLKIKEILEDGLDEVTN